MKNFRKWTNRVLGTALIGSLIAAVGIFLVYPFLGWLKHVEILHPWAVKIGLGSYLLILLCGSIYGGYRSQKSVAKLLGEDDEAF